MKGVLIIHNVTKRGNRGELFRSACAFGIEEVVVVGSRELPCFGSRGTERYMKFKQFNRLKKAAEYIKNELGLKIIGIEIGYGAVPVEQYKFDHPAGYAFLPGNEGHGLTPDEVSICDGFIYIRQFGAGVASLNVNVATSIILQYWSLQSGNPELSVGNEGEDEHKFDNTVPPSCIPHSGYGVTQMQSMEHDDAPPVNLDEVASDACHLFDA